MNIWKATCIIALWFIQQPGLFSEPCILGCGSFSAQRVSLLRMHLGPKFATIAEFQCTDDSTNNIDGSCSLNSMARFIQYASPIHILMKMLYSPSCFMHKLIPTPPLNSSIWQMVLFSTMSFMPRLANGNGIDVAHKARCRAQIIIIPRNEHHSIIHLTNPQVPYLIPEIRHNH